MRTTDGGLHWTDVSPPSIPGRTNTNDEFFLDASHAWVAETTTSSSACVDHVVIFRTADGGRTWQQQVDPPLPVWPTALTTDVLWTGSNNHAQLLDFIDPQNGWLLLGTGPANTAQAGVSPSWIGAAWRTGSVWNTNDGGATWAVAPNPFVAVGCVPTSGALVKATTSFSSPLDGWMLASCERSPYPANLLVTHDAGASWSRVTTPLAPEEAPLFFDSRHGVAKATGGLIVTSDVGVTWMARTSPGSYGVDFINKNDGWAIGAGDNAAAIQCRQPNDKACDGNFRLYYTHDGGVTWTPGARTSLTMMAPKWWPPAYLHFVDSKTGFVQVGEDPLERDIYVTHEGGQTWTKVNAMIQGP
jgi:BNR/Asp-box repeat